MVSWPNKTIATYYDKNIFYRNMISLNYWVCHVRKKDHRKLLKCCKPFGLLLGPYGIGRPALGLVICDDIIHNTVEAFLLDSL